MVWFCHLIYGTSVAHSLLCQGYGASVARGVCVCHPLYSAPPERPLAAVSLLLEPMSWICNPGLRARFDIFSKFVFASNSGKEISTFRFNRFAAWLTSLYSSIHPFRICRMNLLFLYYPGVSLVIVITGGWIPSGEILNNFPSSISDFAQITFPNSKGKYFFLQYLYGEIGCIFPKIIYFWEIFFS